MSRMVKFTNEISPICLATSRVQTMTPSIVAGWGLTKDDGETSNILNQVGVTIRDNSFCSGFKLDDSQLCAGNTVASNGIVKDSCQVVIEKLVFV